MPYLWIFYGIYFIIKTYIKRFKFEILKKNMTEQEIDLYSYKEVKNLAKGLVEKSHSKVNVVGAENIPQEACVFVSNHQSDFDILAMLGYIDKPMGFIAKKELEKLPGVNYWMKQIHCVFMDRENSRDSVRAILDGIENLKKGYSMVIYPEGTRSKGEKLLEFKKGAMKLATKSGAPIVPITINGTYKIFEAQEGKKIKAANVDIIISKPIYTKELSKEEQNKLSDTVKGIIEKNLKSLNEQK
ncbi:1-acyl-sn-glycerol-3-phosphate acyltransferase [Clostridium sp. USBA 49]|jgi:1-acyl-sn-glycerol-3-phosphate acyltransferase|uniref:lysophospholipid acyltransferase family protein n=1 Tax=Clostridium TaxID=1485 RepID=UPI00099A3530|nr:MULTISPECIES: lysophospholipid acyltransferase family protein [Clostridium]SKA83847.1 1-acyl-sn-glycerol-3-phosphate acyltransferase [Clostridium sp. USBA 49]